MIFIFNDYRSILYNIYVYYYIYMKTTIGIFDSLDDYLHFIRNQRYTWLFFIIT